MSVESSIDEMRISDYIYILVKRKVLLLSVLSVIVLGAIFYAGIQPRVYESSIDIMIIPSHIERLLSLDKGTLRASDGLIRGEVMLLLPTPTRKTAWLLRTSLKGQSFV